MALPRMRQLRRDKYIFSLAMNAVRLHLEEDDRLTRQPHLHEAPNAEMQLIRQAADSWIGLAAAYLMQKYRCSMGVALELIGTLLTDLRAGMPLDEVRKVPLGTVLRLPPGLLPAPPAAP